MSDSFTYRDLDAWKQGMTLVEDCYRATVSFPANELYGLTNQIRRAAVSIPSSNVAEGRCRHTTKVYANHVSIALGSLGELETCIELSTRLGLFKEGPATRLLASAGSVGRLLSALYGSLERKLQESPAASP
jgi:four helix bundle protein